MSSLEIGINVKIQRSSGQIQTAQVTTVNNETKTVTVEWPEGVDIKGKEVDFEQIFRLNPGLVLPNIINTSNVVNNNNINNNPVTTNNNVNIKKNSSMLPVRTNVAQSKGSLRMKPSARQTLTANAANQIQVQATVTHPPPLSAAPVNQSISMNNGNNARNNAENRRRTNAVKEVERIKKLREERRARQAEQKAEKIELMSAADPSVQSQYEFAVMIRDYRAQMEFTPINANDSVDDHQICVAVRKRPLNKRESLRKDIDVITIATKDMVMVHEPKQKVDLTKYLENQRFRFDYAFDDSADNELVYKYTAKPLVKTIFQGGMATCFAYGQTGSGKTHTMGGDFNGKTQDSAKGIYALTARDVFTQLRLANMQGEDLYVCASFFEIYSGKVFDLLNGKTKLRVLEDAKGQVQVVGLSERRVDCVDDVLKLIQTGNNIRTSGVTSANNHSSRSHAVFQLILKYSTNKMKGKFSLIDLAGNERGADTSSSNRQTRMEGAEINKSLLALKECIRALGRKGAHLPFRGSKLTQVLRDSFIGENSRTCMIAMISPGFQSCEHTLNTLRYANRVKELGTDYADNVKPEELDDDINGDHLDLTVANTNDLYIQDKISHLTEHEEEIIDMHKSLYEDMHQWKNEHQKLINMSCQVDYDVDAYVQNLEELLIEQELVIGKMKERVINFKGLLREEELLSKKLNG